MKAHAKNQTEAEFCTENCNFFDQNLFLLPLLVYAMLLRVSTVQQISDKRGSQVRSMMLANKNEAVSYPQVQISQIHFSPSLRSGAAADDVSLADFMFGKVSLLRQQMCQISWLAPYMAKDCFF